MQNIDKISEVFINWQALLLAFATFAIIGVIRAVGTKKDKDGKVIGGWAQNDHFQSLLPLFPYLITLVVVFLPSMPLPDMVKGATVKVLFAVWAGWLSDKSFQIVKSVLENSFHMKFGTDQ